MEFCLFLKFLASFSINAEIQVDLLYNRVLLLLILQVENKKLALDFWERSLNPLTWTEILRQVLVAAGFGSKQGAMRREALSRVLKLVALVVASVYISFIFLLCDKSEFQPR